MCTLLLFQKVSTNTEKMSNTMKNTRMDSVRPIANTASNSGYDSFTSHGNVAFYGCISITRCTNYKTNMSTCNIVRSIACHIIISKVAWINAIFRSATYFINLLLNIVFYSGATKAGATIYICG